MSAAEAKWKRSQAGEWHLQVAIWCGNAPLPFSSLPPSRFPTLLVVCDDFFVCAPEREWGLLEGGGQRMGAVAVLAVIVACDIVDKPKIILPRFVEVFFCLRTCQRTEQKNITSVGA